MQANFIELMYLMRLCMYTCLALVPTSAECDTCLDQLAAVTQQQQLLEAKLKTVKASCKKVQNAKIALLFQKGLVSVIFK